jgi:hypothetical protein
MVKDCHRCGSPLASPEAFCPSCGAPQLFYDSATENPDALPDSRVHELRNVQWKSAIGVAITFGVPVGVLCSSVIPVLASGCCLWVLGGAVAAVGLYQRRSATRVLPRPMGVRIGVIVGMLAAAVAAAFNAGMMVMQRYVFHGGEAMDKIFQQSLDQGSALAAQVSSVSQAQALETMRFWSSADGRAAWTLLTMLLSSVGITLFSMIGGALGTRIFSGRNASLRNS